MQSMEKHYQFYQEKNKRRQTGKPLYFPSAVELLYEIARPKIAKISETTWCAEDAAKKRIETLQEATREREERKEKYRKRNISTQEVLPRYLIILINKYWKECNELLRFDIARECAKYKNNKTVLFFRQILFGEKDWFIRNFAFRTLQRFDEVVFLPPKGKGKQVKRNVLVDMFGCDYREDIGKGPLDIMKEFFSGSYIQTARDFDVFISHSVSNAQVVESLVKKLNDMGLVAFVDWKSDREDLERSKSSAYTADVLRLRMRQSKCLVVIRTKESDSSVWVSWELGYFSALNRKTAIMIVEEDLDEGPEFVRGLPRVSLNGCRLEVRGEHGRSYDFKNWLQHDNSEDEVGGL